MFSEKTLKKDSDTLTFTIDKELPKEKDTNLYLFTVNHKTAPVVIREKFAIPECQLNDAIQNLKKFKALDSFLILSTCNRTEIYFTTCNPVNAYNSILSFFSSFFSTEEKVVKEYCTLIKGNSVVNHTFELTCGLDSLVLGERQILSQVKSAYSFAQSEKTLDKTLELLFQFSIKSAKEIHKNTNLSKSSQSISTAAVELANKICGPLKTKKVLILGAGLMAKLALEHITKLGGTKETIVLNRSPHKVIEFPDRYNVTKTIPFEKVYEALNNVDILICACGSPHFIIFAKDFKAIRNNSQNPLFIFDISMPRNVDSEFGRMDNVKLFDIDSLQEIYNKTIKPNNEDMLGCSEIISEHKSTFYSEIAKENLFNLIKGLKEKVEKIRLNKISRLLGTKTVFTRKELDYITKNIINTIFHLPLQN